MEEKKYALEFRGGKAMSLLPVLILIVFAVYFFGFAGVYDTLALALGGVVALIIGSFFAKSIPSFWNAAIHGMADELGNILALILLVVGIFGKMMTHGHIAQGFIWIGDLLNVTGSTICVFSFIATAIIATATGSSIGTILTMVPIILPVGAVTGANMPVLVGALLSGALFGDSIGPVSDVTIAASQTQEFRDGSRPSIGGVVRARVKYSLIAAVLAIILFAIFGGTGGATAESQALMAEYSDPKGLLMLIPMIVLLIVAFVTKNIFMAATIGTIVGTAVGLVFGILTPADILYVQDGAMSGFVIEGINNMIGTILAVYMIVAMIGILKECGMMDSLVVKLTTSKVGKSPMGADFIIALGTAITSLLIGSMNGPACLMYGPIANEVGKGAGLHPYRRANLVACFSSTLPTMNPFSSVFIILTMGGVSSVLAEYSFIDPISPMSLPGGMFYCMTFPLVFIISILTGWSREYEGENGEVVKKKALKSAK
ncbi:Na+/H+ antiporter NhaC family protein [Anaerotignum sp.]